MTPSNACNDAILISDGIRNLARLKTAQPAFDLLGLLGVFNSAH